MIEAPGLGKTTWRRSMVVQPFPTSHTNIFGRDSKDVCLLECHFVLLRLADAESGLPVTWTRAQFWYMFWSPMRLNHDQLSSTESDDGAKSGIVKSYFRANGHPPIIDSMTLKVTPLSYERDIWQEPPRCVAPP
jgi:hypothetical protein